jgi:hypothetical protein
MAHAWVVFVLPVILLAGCSRLAPPQQGDLLSSNRPPSAVPTQASVATPMPDGDQKSTSGQEFTKPLWLEFISPTVSTISLLLAAMSLAISSKRYYNEVLADGNILVGIDRIDYASVPSSEVTTYFEQEDATYGIIRDIPSVDLEYLFEKAEKDETIAKSAEYISWWYTEHYKRREFDSMLNRVLGVRKVTLCFHLPIINSGGNLAVLVGLENRGGYIELNNNCIIRYRVTFGKYSEEFSNRAPVEMLSIKPRESILINAWIDLYSWSGENNLTHNELSSAIELYRSINRQSYIDVVVSFRVSEGRRVRIKSDHISVRLAKPDYWLECDDGLGERLAKASRALHEWIRRASAFGL